MALIDPDLALGVSPDEGRVRLSDTSCGRCSPCDAGWLLWCSSPGGPRRSVQVDVPAAAAEKLRATLVIIAALAEAPVVGRVVLVHGDPEGAVASAAVAMRARAVLSAGEPIPSGGSGILVGSNDEIREQLAELTPTGRADVVVVARGDARLALRAVVRGGYLAIGSAVVPAATVTEFVQRELRVAGPKDAWSVLRRPMGSEVLRGIEVALRSEQE